MATKEAIYKILRQSDAVCFDVDSTVIREEGIDELAKFCDKGTQVAEITQKAMSGSMSYQDALRLRLNIIQPRRQQVYEFISKEPPKLTPGVKKLIESLQEKRISVYLISGGFKEIILPVATQINIPPENIFANRLKYYYNGDYAGFDEEALTSKSGGKGKVVELLKRRHGYRNLVLIGDGATDLEACPPADAFIGYGGNVMRPCVKAKAKWYVTDFNEIYDVLNMEKFI